MNTTAFTVEVEKGPISCLLDGSGDTLLVLGHGAGAGMDSTFMVDVTQLLVDRGLTVGRFNFAYMEQGRRAPDRHPVLVSTYEAVVNEMMDRSRPQRVFLGGKSLGGRMASHVVADGFAASGLVFLGYPLHPPGKPERIRDAHLKDLNVPMLFVEGTRDPFCPLETLERVREGLVAHTHVAVIDGGDHSFRVLKRSGRTTTQAVTQVADEVASWISSISND